MTSGADSADEANLGVPVIAQHAEDQANALRIAQKIGTQVLAHWPAQGLALACDDSGLALHDCAAPHDEPLRVDFFAGALGFRQRAGFRRDELLARAVGVKGQFLPRVLDATAGLGRDAFLLASLGCQVTLCERHPVVHALLEDGLRRLEARVDPALLSRMQLHAQDSATVLCSASSAHCYDVILLDPMFPERKKSALVKKPMRMFHQLVGADDDAASLLELALQRAMRRVVVKRPRHAEYLGGRVPSFDYEGKAVRFDVYLTALS